MTQTERTNIYGVRLTEQGARLADAIEAGITAMTAKRWRECEELAAQYEDEGEWFAPEFAAAREASVGLSWDFDGWRNTLGYLLEGSGRLGGVSMLTGSKDMTQTKISKQDAITALRATPTGLAAEDEMYRIATANSDWIVVDSNGDDVAADSPDRPLRQLYLLHTNAPWMADDGNQEIRTSADTPLGAAEEYVSDGDWGEGKSSVVVDVWRYALDYDGDEARVAESTHDVDAGEDPEAPGECGTDDDDHDWQSPLELVGGCRENPGVFSTGGTSFRFESVCAVCGTYRTATSAGMQRNPGEPSETVEYREADDASLAWVAANA